MKTLFTITTLLLTISLNAQTQSVEPLDSTGSERLRVSQFQQEYNEIRNSLGMREVNFQFVRLETTKELKYEDLQDREKWLLLEKIEDAYFRFNHGKKEMEPSTLLAFFESENPICKWSGLHEEVEENRLVKVYKVDMKVMLKIFDL